MESSALDQSILHTVRIHLERSLHDTWHLAPRYFHDPPSMAEDGVTLFAFAPWFSIIAMQKLKGIPTYRNTDGIYPRGCEIYQEVIKYSFYRDTVCLGHGDLLCADKHSIEYLRRDYL
eukprot:IDg7653t1